MWKLRGGARNRGVSCRNRAVRGLERLESRCVLSAGALLPIAGPLPRIVELAAKQDSSAIELENTAGPRDSFFESLASTPSQASNSTAIDLGRISGGSVVAVTYHPSTFGGNWGTTPYSAFGFNSGAPRFFDFAPVEVQIYVIHFVMPGSDAGQNEYASNAFNNAKTALNLPFNDGMMDDSNSYAPQLAHPGLHIGVVPGMDLAVTTAARMTQHAGMATNATQFVGTGAPPMTTLATPANYSVLSATVGSHTAADGQLASDPLAPLSATGAASTNVQKKSPTIGAAEHSSPASQPAVAPTSVELIVAGAQLSPANFVVNLIEGKASLADVPFNLKGVERALQTAVTDLERLSARVTNWAEENQVTIVAVTATAVAVGGLATFYLRRGASASAELRDDETSSNWLFLRLQTTPGEA